jgi:hypothetical protein
MRLVSVLGWFFFVCLSIQVRAQEYVGLGVKEVQSRLKKEARLRQQPGRSLPPATSAKEMFTAVVSTAIDIQLSCDSAGLCFAEQYLCADEPSALQCLRKILSKKEYGWRPLNDNQHVSTMERQRLLEIYHHHETFWVVQILRTDWSPLQYQLLFSTTLNLAK